MATAPKPAAKSGKGPNLQAVPASEDGAAAPGKSGKKKLIFIVLALVLGLAGGGFAAWHFLGAKQDKHAEGKAAAPAVDHSQPPVFIVMEPFTVNLQTEGVEQFLQVSFTLQTFEQAQVELIKLYMPQVRSRLLLLLSSKKASDILNAEGKKKLAEEIMAQVNEPFAKGMPKQSVADVFFTSFVIQ